MDAIPSKGGVPVLARMLEIRTEISDCLASWKIQRKRRLSDQINETLFELLMEWILMQLAKLLKQ